MKPMPSILALSLSGIVLPVAGAGHQGFGNELGQKASPSSDTSGGNKPWSVPYYLSPIITIINRGLSPIILLFVPYYSPTPEQIGPNHLLADAATALAFDLSTPTTLQNNAQGLIDFTQTLIEGEELMFVMDVPVVPAQEASIVLAQAAVPAAGVTPSPDFLFKVCKETESTGDPMSAMRGVDPAYMLTNYLNSHTSKQVVFDLADIKNVTMLQDTTHGKLNRNVAEDGQVYFMYDPTPDYIGNDRAVFQAEFEGKVYKIVVELHVFIAVDEHESSCPPPKLIKVNKTAKPSSGVNGYDLDSITVTFADLEGSALGLTNTNGITLDTTAANYNWFIDLTPGQNEEYLPTSNPNEWVAKAGSAAYGKMDMLSVLLHEYGHALGINHSPDSNDYMGTTLTAGVRRLPSAEEMVLMQGLVAQAKAALTAATLSPWERVGVRGGGGEFPTLPLGTSFIGFLGLLRSSRYGGVSIVPDERTLVTQYDWAANATLTNGSLNAAEGWSTQGNVEIANGAAVMREVSTSQTRLSQVFQLNPTDRFLSFTLSGAALENLPHPNPLPVGEGANVAQGAAQTLDAPDDAFEVALLDANTGASLLGGTGLTRSDAFLNMQADGTQNLADCVTCINNPDGSRTYRVDLAGLPAGVIANLSFDLIGFGANGSHVTVSDVRLSGLPQLHDGAVTLLEDGTLAFDPFAQVDNAAVLQLGSHIVDQPAHGAVTVNADGSVNSASALADSGLPTFGAFSYTPQTDYFGTDSFTYRLSDGPLLCSPLPQAGEGTTELRG